MSWVEVEMSWVEMDGAGWSWVELGARFSNPNEISSCQYDNHFQIVFRFVA